MAAEMYLGRYSQHLTLFTYEELLKSPSAYPHLLSPGGVFSPMDSSWLVEYLRERDEIGLVLVATLKPEKKSGGSHSTIPVNLELLDSRSGNTLSSWSVDVEIESKKAIQEYGNVISPSRAFEKQPLGKACAKLAILIKESLETRLASVNPGRTKEISSNRAALEGTTGGGSCPVSLRITYGYKHSASQSYVLVANGLDQSNTLANGVASFSAPEGELLIQFTLRDAPYKMETENLYQLSTRHSCRFGQLVLDVGPGGDAHQQWQ